VTAKDPRWVVLAETGEYATLGRHREPDEDEIASAEMALTRAGRSGWLAVMSHSIYSGTTPEFVMVRPLGDPRTTFKDAVQVLRRRAA